MIRFIGLLLLFNSNCNAQVVTRSISSGKWELVDTSGKVVVQPQFQQIEAMEDGTFAYKKGGRWGFMNRNGVVHCSPRYDSIYDNKKNWCLVTKGGRFGFCKTSGREIAAPIYGPPVWDDYIHWGELLSSGRIAMSKQDSNGECKLGVIDSNGRVILPFEYECYDEIVYHFGSCLVAKKNGKDVMINSDGKEVYLGNYDWIDRRRHGYEYFFPMKGDKVGLVSPDGKLWSIPKYDRIDFESVWDDELKESSLFFIVEQDSKIGLLDSNGRIILLPIYDELTLKDKNLVELISDTSVRLFNIKKQQYEPFNASDTYKLNGQVGASRCDSIFTEVTTKYDTLIPILDGLFITHDNQKWGVIDSCGNIIIPFECDGISQTSDFEGIGSMYNKSHPLPTGLERYQYEGTYFYFTRQGRSEKTGGDFILKIEYKGNHNAQYVIEEGPYYFLPDRKGDTIQTKPRYPYNIRSMRSI